MVSVDPPVDGNEAAVDVHEYFEAVARGDFTARRKLHMNVGPVLVDQLGGDRWNRRTVKEPRCE